MTAEPDDFLPLAEAAARAGAAELMAWRGRFAARSKVGRDLVTDADLASEQAIRTLIATRHPSHGILGEEAPAADQLLREHCWVIDPLDGTTNYVHDFPCFAVSVALARRGRLVAGAVFDPVRDECFTAAAGQGAQLNGKPIAVTDAREIDEALLAVSFPANLDCESPDLNAFLRIAPRCQAIRRTGSAALNLAYVACGRLDGHWAHEIHPWDSAAGVLLIQEAGGFATGVDGRDFDLAAGDYLVACTPELHAALAPLVRRPS